MTEPRSEIDPPIERIPCPDCGGVGKVIGTVDGVPASVCTKYTTCERCWPREADGTKKFWDDGTAGTIPQDESGSPGGPDV